MIDKVWDAHVGRGWIVQYAITIEDAIPPTYSVLQGPGILVSDLLVADGPYEDKDKYYD